jgi:hypothetical protein
MLSETKNALAWRWSDKAALADAVGITRQHLNEVLTRRCGVSSRELADKLEIAAFNLGYAIPWDAWMLNKETDNPFFSGKTGEEEIYKR